jgi:hypothetical protein
MFHIAAAPPCAWGFARILRKILLQRFHASLSEAIFGLRRRPRSAAPASILVPMHFDNLVGLAWTRK